MTNPKNNLTKTLVFLFAFVMAFSALAVMAPTNEAADNEAPDWSVGDGVAVSMSIDLMDLYNTQQDNISAVIEGMLDDINDISMTLNDFSISQASARAVVMMEVTAVNSTSYTVEQMAAFEIKFAASVSLRAQMPNAGTYDNWSQAWASTSNKTMTATVSIIVGVS